MDDIQLYEWITTVFHALGERESNPPSFYWHEDDDDKYCWACFLKHNPNRDDTNWGGGHTQGEEDGCVHCVTCERILAYSLTDYGAGEELDHFEEHPWDWNSPDDCYHIARMLGCWIGWGAWKVDDLPDRDRVIKAIDNGIHAPAAVCIARGASEETYAAH